VALLAAAEAAIGKEPGIDASAGDDNDDAAADIDMADTACDCDTPFTGPCDRPDRSTVAARLL